MELPQGVFCNDVKLFDELHSLKQPLQVTLGNGCPVEATGQGTVVLEITLTSGKTGTCRCILHKVLYVPDLSYNLLSVSKAVEARKVVEFNNTSCQMLDTNRKPITLATRVGTELSDSASTS